MIVEVDALAAAACHVILLRCLKRGYAPPSPSPYVGPLATHAHGTQAEALRAQARREPEERQPCRWVKEQGRGGKEARFGLAFLRVSFTARTASRGRGTGC